MNADIYAVEGQIFVCVGSVWIEIRLLIGGVCGENIEYIHYIGSE